MKKYKKYAGANELSPSRSEYFSWINNTNEGSTEKQSLINLEFFNYLYKTYSMVLDIYAMDAGNIDGADNTYESLDSPKIKAQYPEEFKNMALKAKKMHTRLGIWMGPDGFKETIEDARKRKDMLVHLCKDYNFELFKFDRVCSGIRDEKRKYFEEMLIECRKYSKDLIALNHRLNLKESEKYTTTFLWEGLETYIDVHGVNRITAPHNRAFMFDRGFTPEYKRLTEDHGVCLSSSIDYFEDELVYQAFNRSLILSPEIYGNPWLLMDTELAKLARIFNLSKTYRMLLIKGFPIGDEYGACAFSRGNNLKRIISTGNDKWKGRTIHLPLNEKIGLKTNNRIVVSTHFPYEEFLGIYNYNDIVDIYLPSFRAVLIEVSDINTSSDYLVNSKYEVLHEKNNIIDKVNIIETSGDISLFKDGNLIPYSNEKIDVSMKEPLFIKTLTKEVSDVNKEFLYESAYFTIDNDNLELRSLRRSGETKIKEVKNARDAFFNQDSYIRKGIVSSSIFDGNDDTIFDTKSKLYEGGHRINGGCLRVDFGSLIEIDTIEIEYFDGLENPPYIFSPQVVKDNMEVSRDLINFDKAKLLLEETIRKENLIYYRHCSDIKESCDGYRKKAVYSYKGIIRYCRLENQMDRIFSLKAFKDKKEIKFINPKVSNLFSPYNLKNTKHVIKETFMFDSLPVFPYLAIAIEGKTGNEGVTVTYEIDGIYKGAENRAPQYPANVFEYYVKKVDGFYTFYITLDKTMIKKQISVYVQFENNITKVDSYLCDKNIPREGIIKNIILKERE